MLSLITVLLISHHSYCYKHMQYFSISHHSYCYYHMQCFSISHHSYCYYHMQYFSISHHSYCYNHMQYFSYHTSRTAYITVLCCLHITPLVYCLYHIASHIICTTRIFLISQYCPHHTARTSHSISILNSLNCYMAQLRAG